MSSVRTMQKRAEQFLKSERIKELWDRWRGVFFVTVLILVALVYYYKASVVAAVVNGKIIWRREIVKDLEKRYGQELLDTKVAQILVDNEAQRQGVSVGMEEVNEEIIALESSLEEQGQNLDTFLAQTGYNRNILADQIKMQKTLMKLVNDQIEVSDEEVEQYIDENKEMLPETETDEELREQVKDGLKQQKEQTETEALLMRLRNNARVTVFAEF